MNPLSKGSIVFFYASLLVSPPIFAMNKYKKDALQRKLALNLKKVEEVNKLVRRKRRSRTKNIDIKGKRKNRPPSERSSSFQEKRSPRMKDLIKCNSWKVIRLTDVDVDSEEVATMKVVLIKRKNSRKKDKRKSSFSKVYDKQVPERKGKN